MHHVELAVLTALTCGLGAVGVLALPWSSSEQDDVFAALASSYRRVLAACRHQR